MSAMRLIVLAGCVLSVMALGAGTAAADDDDDDKNGNKVRWRQIVGILAPNSSVGGFPGVPVPWTARAGRAVVDLDTGRIKFRVVGLVIAAPVPAVPPGVATSVTKVRGTLVCDGRLFIPPGGPPSDAANTPPVPLDDQGNAEFDGVVSIPSSCLDPNNRNLAFLIRIAETSVPFILNLWNAHGAVRVP